MSPGYLRLGTGLLAAPILALAALWAISGLMSPLSPLGVHTAAAPDPPWTVSTDHPVIPVSGHYPEALVADAAGRLIVGTEDGTLVRMDLAAGSARAVEYARVQGHPIGLALDASGAGLWSATFPVGLQHVTPRGVMTSVLEVDGVPLAFADDTAVGPDGKVYVTEASTRWNPVTTTPSAPYVLWDMLEGRANGRLVVYEPETGGSRTLLDALYFPSGVTLTADGSALLVVEVSRYRVLRYELAAGHPDPLKILADNLPGYPDDVFIGPEGDVWVSIAAPRSALIDRWILPFPTVIRLITSLPHHWQHALLAPAAGGGSVLKLDDRGRTVCRIAVPAGAPPANGIAWRTRLLLGRLGGQNLLDIDPTLCAGSGG